MFIYSKYKIEIIKFIDKKIDKFNNYYNYERSK